MIDIKLKEDCCGCNACVQRCPKQCISMVEDNEGFLYPRVNLELCIDCHLCEKVCPVINQNKSRQPLEVYAAKNIDENIRRQSSSGGIFTLLAEYIIDQGGVVFGARWDKSNWSVVHDYTESEEGISIFRSSKYLQSKIGDSFRKAELFLKQGRKVLFTGTPCQIAGLNHFLNKNYENLITCDVFCYSVPSPKVWKEYLSEQLTKLGWTIEDILSISFRNKSHSWKHYHFLLQHVNGIDFHEELASRNPFMKGFLSDLYTRPSCSACPSKRLKSGSDITIGDYWGIERLKPEIDDDKGISAVVVNTSKGLKCINQICTELYPMNYEQLIECNSALIKSPFLSNSKRELFFKSTETSFSRRVQILCRPSFYARLKKIINAIVTKFFKEEQKIFLKRLIKRTK